MTRAELVTSYFSKKANKINKRILIIGLILAVIVEDLAIFYAPTPEGKFESTNIILVINSFVAAVLAIIVVSQHKVGEGSYSKSRFAMAI